MKTILFHYYIRSTFYVYWLDFIEIVGFKCQWDDKMRYLNTF